MNVRPITDPVAGEQVLRAEPDLAPVTHAGWRRRLNLFPGRALSDTALRGEQEARAGRLATTGQTFSHGVVSGLQVAVENPLKTGDDEEPGPVRILVSAGLGLTIQGEDVVVPRALRVPLDELWVYLPAAGERPSRAAPAPAPEPEPAPPPAVEAFSDIPAMTRMTPVGEGTGEPLGLPALRSLPARSGVDEDEVPTLAPPVFRGPWSQLMADVRDKKRDPLPRVMVLVLQPVVADVVGGGDPGDACEQDPSADAFADWRIVDGCRLALYAWPWTGDTLTVNPARPTWRNELADLVFAMEARYPPGRFHPWEEAGVPMALLGFGTDGRPAWVDAYTVVRDGGKPRTRTALVAGTGTPFLWQARLKQFAEQAAGLRWDEAGKVPFSAIRHMPAAGILPRQAIGELKKPGNLFPKGWEVEAVPVPLEQLDAAFEASAALAPYDRDAPFDRVRLLVPVPTDVYHPRLLKDETVSPEFGEALAAFAHREDEYVRRREALRRRAEGLVAGSTGVRPRFPRPEEDPERVVGGSLTNPNPVSGGKTWITSAPANTPASSEYLTVKGARRLEEGDTFFVHVHLDVAATPVELALSFPVSDDEPEDVSDITSDRAAVRWGPIEGARLAGARLGDVPAKGSWVRLRVPAHAIGAEGRWVSGVRFTVVGGKAHWDLAGLAFSTDRVWMDDAVPQGSTGTGGRWIPLPPAHPTSPTAPRTAADDDPKPLPDPRSGARALELSALLATQAEAVFQADNPAANVDPAFAVAPGDVLFAYVWLEKDTKTRELMLQWQAGGSWEHRAYWGDDLIGLGSAGTSSRWHMGGLPATERWVRLEVPAAHVGLEGKTVRGMAFNIHGGRAVWDRVGIAPRLSRPRGSGLMSQYFSDANHYQLHSSGVEGPVKFTWTERPKAKVGEGTDKWSARWLGQVMPLFTEKHTLVLTVSGPAELYLGGEQPVIKVPEGTTGTVTKEAEVELDARRRYDLRVDFRPTAHDKAEIHLQWKSANLPLQTIPVRTLFPSATAGGGTEVPRIEEVWADDGLPVDAARPLGWTWGAAVAELNPPEEDYGTVVQGDVRVAQPLVRLRQELAGYPMRVDERAKLDELGLEGYVQYLDAKVRRCDDVVNFGFIRVQSDIYRFRRLMLGTTAATRLATSPALAQIVNAESAVTVRDDLVKFLDASGLQQVKKPGDETSAATAELAAGSDHPLALQARTVSGSGLLSAETLEMRAELASFVPPDESRSTPLSGASRTFLVAGATAGISLARETELVRPIEDEGGGTVSLMPRELDGDGGFVRGDSGSYTAPRIRPLAPRPGASDDEVLRKQPIVGETYDFRTVTVGERLETPRANEAKSYTLLTRYEVLKSLLELDINIDDINVPGFVSYTGGVLDRREVKRPGNPLVLHITKRAPRRLGAVRFRLEADTLEENDPDDADEARFFSVGVELLDATIAALRAVEGRVQQYRDALNRCRAVLNELRQLSNALAARLKTVEGELAEARHDLVVTQALLDEENRRVKQIRDRRLAILRQHVTFLAYHRPRVVHGTLTAPVR
ncbi:MAG TPA: PA14 domain-containing protein, partial [Longimicrobium sp.]|nr:PA14 domain-containing protein [Longimicrobium sp.]